MDKKQKELWDYIPLLILVVIILLYLSTVSRYNISYADSSELVLLGYFGGIAHPPGYALLIFILNLFFKIPINISPAFQANIFATIIQICNLILIYLINKFFLNKISKNKIIVILTSLTGTLIVAVSELFWLYANFLEKYTLISLLILLSLYLSIIKRSIKINLILGSIIGLGIMYHEIYWLSIPGLLFYWIANYKIFLQKKSFYIILGILIALITSLILMWRLNLNNAIFSYKFDNSFLGLINHLHRRSQIIDIDGNSGAYLHKNIFFDMYQALQNYLNSFFSFSIIGILLGLIGILKLKNINKGLFLYITTTIMISGPIFMMYIGWPLKISDNPISWYKQLMMIRRLYITSHTIFALTIPFGVFFIFNKYKKHHIQIIISFLLLIISIAISNYPKVNLKNYNTAENMFNYILKTLPENTILIVDDDFAIFGSLYQSLIYKKRPDIKIIPVNPNFRVNNFVNTVDNLNIPFNPESIFSIISQNFDKYPVILLDLNQNLYRLLGTESGITFAGVEGSLPRIYSNNDVIKNNLNIKIFNPPKYPIYLSQLIKAKQSQRFITSGKILNLQGNNKNAVQYINKALSLLPNWHKSTKSFLKNIDLFKINPYYSGELPKINIDTIITSAQLTLINQSEKNAQALVFNAILIDPYNINIYTILQNIYNDFGDQYREQIINKKINEIKNRLENNVKS